MKTYHSRTSRLKISGKQPWRQICKAGIGAATAVAVPAVTFAGLFYWTGDHDGNWNTTGGLPGTNWSSSPDFNNGTPGLPGSADSVFFVLFGAGNLNTSLGQDFSINSLTFTTDALATNPIAIGGTNTLTLGSGGMTNNSNAPITLSTNVTLGAAQTWINNSVAQPLLVTGAISAPAATTLTLSGAGAYNFQGANTYTGTTVLSTLNTALTLSGANGSLASTGITLAGGTTLNLDNNSGVNNNRIGDATGISSSGAVIALKGTGATETVGTLTLVTGQTRVNVDAGSTLTFGSPTLASITRSNGSAVNFSSTGTVNLPDQALNSGGIIGAWATIGNIDSSANGNALDFATIDPATKNVIPFSGYVMNNLASNSTANVKVDGTSGTLPSGLINITAASTTVNSLYVTGTARIAFNNSGTGPTSNMLIIGSGGIISNGATQNLGSSTQLDLTNAAVIGNGIIPVTQADGNTGNNGIDPNLNTSAPQQGRITSSTSELVITTASSLRINAAVTNNGTNVVNLVKDGAGTLDFSDGNLQTNKSVNTYTGTTTINGGILIINNETQLGTAPTTNNPAAIVLNGGELRATATIAIAAARGITVGPQGGTLTYNGGNTTTEQSFQITGPGSLTYQLLAPITNQNAFRLNFPVNSTNYQGATIFSPNKSATPLAGTTVNTVIFFGLDNQVPDTSPVIMANTDGGGVVNLAGKSDVWGSLAGPGAIVNGFTTTSNLTVGGNNLSTNYSGNLGKVGITFNVGSGSVQGGNNVSSTFSSTNAAAATATTPAITLTKLGTGTMTMSGSSQYTGATNINGGTLLVGSGTGITSAASLANTTVTVGNGTLTGALGGNGTIGGAVTVTSTGHLAPAMSPTTTNTLTINNNLTINGGTLDFNFGAAPTIAQGNIGVSDLVKLTNSGSSVTLTGNITVNVTPVVNGPSGFGIGAYKLIDESTTSGAFNNTASFKINGSTNFNYSIVANGGQLDPTVGGGTVPLGDLYLQVLAGNPAFTWDGTTNGAWDTSTPNWTSASAGTVYSNGSNITFDDTAHGPTAITLASAVTPNIATFANGGLNYSFSGAAITLSPTGTGITKNQIGDVLFNNAVTTPIVNITGGSITVGTTGNLHSTGGINVGPGAVNVNGTLNTPTVTATAGGSINVGSNGTLNSGIILNLNGGTAAFSNATQNLPGINGTGSVVLNGTALDINVTTPSTVASAISGSGSLIKDTAGTLTLTNANTYNGGTTISKGVLFAGNTTGSGTGTGLVQVLSGGTLAGTGSVASPVTVSTGGAIQGTGPYSGLVTLNGILAPAGFGVIGTTSLGSLTVNTSGILMYDLGPTSASDTANATGAVSIAGNSTINVDLLSGITAADYPLITSTTPITIVGTPNFTITHSGPGDGAGLHYSVHLSSNQQQLLFTVGADPITWTGASNGSWNFTDANWSTPTYTDASRVKFDDNGFLNPTITVEVPVKPVGGMDFENTSSGPVYTIVTDPVNGNVIGGGGGLTINGGGTVSMGSGNTFSGKTAINSGTLIIQDDSSLGTPPSAATPGFLTIAAGSTLETSNVTGFTLAANRGIALGTTAGNPGNVDIEGVITTFVIYGGAIADVAGQSGILNKTGGGTLDLQAANTFSGGLVINGGGIRVRNVASAGTGPVTVNVGGVLSLGAAIANPITLNDGATLGVITAAQSLPATSSLTINGNVTLDTFDPALNTTPFDIIVLGPIHGAGNMNPQTTNGNSPDTGAAIRLRGPASDYSGTITMPNSDKFEIMTTVAGTTPSSPVGTGKFVMTGGTMSPISNTGTFSILNLRNSSTGSVNFGNDVSLTGNGTAALNLLTGAEPVAGGQNAPAGSTVSMGHLTIGDQQNLAVLSNNGLSNTLSFTGVTLAGGTSTFVPSPVGNTAYPTPENLSVGPMNELTPANVVLNGQATTTFRAANNYSGSTSLLSGTLVLGAAGALPTTTALTVSTDLANGTVPTTLNFNSGGTSNDQTVSSLAGTNFTTGQSTTVAQITNTDLAHTRTFTVNQSGVNTSFAGNITGNLNLTKSGNGTLVLSGANSFTGAFNLNGGTVQFTGTNTFAGPTTVSNNATLSVGSDAAHGSLVNAVTLSSGSTLTGAGTVGPVTVQGSAHLAPGNVGDNIAGVITVNGTLDLSANAGPTNRATLYMDLGDPNSAATPIGSDQIRLQSGALMLGGDLQLALFSPSSHTPAVNDVFYIIINGGSGPANGLFSNAPVTDNINDSTGTFTDAAGDTFAISYTANAANPSNSLTNGLAGFTPGQGQDIAVELLNVIPEPGSLATVISGFGVLLGLQRFRRRS